MRKLSKDWERIYQAFKEGLEEIASREDGAERMKELADAAQRISDLSQRHGKDIRDGGPLHMILSAIWEIQGEMEDWE